MTEYEMKALRITELAREYSRLYNVPDVEEKRAKIEQELNELKKELKNPMKMESVNQNMRGVSKKRSFKRTKWQELLFLCIFNCIF